MFEAQRAKQAETDRAQTTSTRKPTSTEPLMQRTADLTRIPLYTQAWSNQPPPWLRLATPQHAPHEEEPLQARGEPTRNKENTTGLPDPLKTGIETLSGISMDDVQVHYHSPKPAQVQALAYTRDTDIHVGPGQERHLAHEAWHVVQQKQGRVKPTLQAKEVAINDDVVLEEEADIMGARAVQIPEAERMRRDGRPFSGERDESAHARPESFGEVTDNNAQPIQMVQQKVVSGSKVNPLWKYLGSDNQYDYYDDGTVPEEKRKEVRKSSFLSQTGVREALASSYPTRFAEDIKSQVKIEAFDIPKRDLKQKPFSTGLDENSQQTELFDGVSRPPWPQGFQDMFWINMYARFNQALLRFEYLCKTGPNAFAWLPRVAKAQTGEDTASIGHKKQWRDYVRDTQHFKQFTVEGGSIWAISKADMLAAYIDRRNLEPQGQMYNSAMAKHYEGDALYQEWAD